MGNTGSQTLPSWPTGRQLGRSMSMAIPMPPQQHMVSKCRPVLRQPFLDHT
jgi:hypothetical protein